MPGRRTRALKFVDFLDLENGNAVSVQDNNGPNSDNSKELDPSKGWSSMKDALKMESYELLDLSAPRCLVLVKSTGEVHQVQVWLCGSSRASALTPACIAFPRLRPSQRWRLTFLPVGASNFGHGGVGS